MKGAIFDIDGTLLDSMSMWDHAGEWYLMRTVSFWTLFLSGGNLENDILQILDITQLREWKRSFFP